MHNLYLDRLAAWVRRRRNTAGMGPSEGAVSEEETAPAGAAS